MSSSVQLLAPHAPHLEAGARMVPLAGYSMPVQYPNGLIAEHQHTRKAAGLVDASHVERLAVIGPDAAAALESLMPVDVLDLPLGKQRYGLRLNEEVGIMDDLRFFHQGEHTWFIVVNGACKLVNIAHIQAYIGNRCT